jgi:hypothetical protein
MVCVCFKGNFVVVVNDLGAWHGNISGTVDLSLGGGAFDTTAFALFSSGSGFTEVDLRAMLTTPYLHVNASLKYDGEACSGTPIMDTGHAELTVLDGQASDVLFTVPSAQVSFTRSCAEGMNDTWSWAVSASGISTTLGELNLTGGDFSASYNSTTEVWLGDLSSNMTLGDGKIPDLQTFWKAGFSSKDGFEELDLRAKMHTQYLSFDMRLEYDYASCGDTAIVNTGTGDLSVLDGKDASDTLFTAPNAALAITRCAGAKNGWSISVSDVTMNLGQLSLTEVDSCLLFVVVCFLLFAFCFLLFSFCCFVVLLFCCFVVLLFCCFVVCCLLFVVCCLLFVVCCLLFVVCCLLFVVCCLLFVVVARVVCPL